MMEKEISLQIMREEIEACQQEQDLYGWEFSSIDEGNLTFTVRLLKTMDGEIYKLYVQFDNYPQWPPFLDFIEESTGTIGIKAASIFTITCR